MTADPRKACRVKVLDRKGKPAFDLCFYGLHAAELQLVVDHDKSGPPEYPRHGAAVIEYALRKRGLDPMNYVCVLFLVEDMPRVAGRCVPREYHRA